MFKADSIIQGNAVMFSMCRAVVFTADSIIQGSAVMFSMLQQRCLLLKV